MKYKIDRKLVFVLDPISGEDDLAGEENNLTCLLLPIFELFQYEVKVVIRNSFDDIQYEIAARRALPSIIFIHYFDRSYLKSIEKIKEKFPDIKFFVFDLRQMSNSFTIFQTTNVFNLK